MSAQNLKLYIFNLLEQSYPIDYMLVQPRSKAKGEFICLALWWWVFSYFFVITWSIRPMYCEWSTMCQFWAKLSARELSFLKCFCNEPQHVYKVITPNVLYVTTSLTPVLGPSVTTRSMVRSINMKKKLWLTSKFRPQKVIIFFTGISQPCIR